MTDLIDQEGWVEIRDSDGHKAALRHLATIRHGEKTYFMLGAIQEEEDGTLEGGFLLVRAEQTPDGEPKYVVEQDREEIERVVNGLVMQTLLANLQGKRKSPTAACTTGPANFAIAASPSFCSEGPTLGNPDFEKRGI